MGTNHLAPDDTEVVLLGVAGGRRQSGDKSCVKQMFSVLQIVGVHKQMLQIPVDLKQQMSNKVGVKKYKLIFRMRHILSR